MRKEVVLNLEQARSQGGFRVARSVHCHRGYTGPPKKNSGYAPVEE